MAKKLKEVRLAYGWTQQQMAAGLGKVPSAPDSAMISRYERGEREPSLFVLLAYGQVSGLVVDVFIDDRITLENFRKMLK
ncbi:MAG: helix-turn-helix domain-containing protein [Acidobacteria bacterium]|nr:helix-turn-helix domain-containing protein [Acidobacteriota bacterium]